MTKWLTLIAVVVVAVALFVGRKRRKRQRIQWETIRASGVKAFDRGDYVEADRKFDEAHSLARALGAIDPRLATSLSDLVKLYGISNARTKLPKFSARWARRVSKEARVAKRILGKTKELRKKSKKLGRKHLEIARDLDELAKLHQNIRFPQPADRLYRRALAIRKRNLGPKHPAVAESYDRLGVIYLGEPPIADYSNFERALAIREDALGPDHPEVARSLERLSRCYGYFRNREGEEGLRLFMRALMILEYAPRQEHVLNQLLVGKAPYLRLLGRTIEADRVDTLTKTLHAKIAQEN